MLSYGKTISKRPEAALRSVQKVKQLNANHRESSPPHQSCHNLWCEGWMTFKWWNSMLCYDIIKVIYPRFSVRNSKKSSWPVTGLQNRGPLKDLNDSKLIYLSPSPDVSTTPLVQWGFQQCLPFSWTTLRVKHCRHPIAIMWVVDTFGH